MAEFATKDAPTSVFSAAAITAAVEPAERGRDTKPAGETRPGISTRTRSRSREHGADGTDEGMAAGVGQ